MASKLQEIEQLAKESALTNQRYKGFKSANTLASKKKRERTDEEKKQDLRD